MVALLSGEEVFINNIHDSERRGDALTAHAKFENESGDHLTLLNVFKAYAKSERPKTWCHDNFLNTRNLIYAAEVRHQLSEICSRVNLEFSSCGNKFDQVNYVVQFMQSKLELLTNGRRSWHIFILFYGRSFIRRIFNFLLRPADRS